MLDCPKCSFKLLPFLNYTDLNEGICCIKHLAYVPLLTNELTCYLSPWSTSCVLH